MSISSTNSENQMVVLEEPTLLRDSSIWTLQRNFYEENGMNCWKDGIVPCFVTSNSFIAYEYANCILGYIRDCYAKDTTDPNEPIYIVEVGAGHGKLGFLILNHLLTFKESFPRGVLKPFVYVMTDFTHVIIDTLKMNPLLKTYVDEGILDFGLFDCENQQDIELINSNKHLNSSTVHNNTIFISNYVFNGLKQDLYNFKDGELQQGLVSVSTDRVEENPESPDIINRMHFNWIFNKADETKPLYDDEQFNKIIQTYQERHNTFTLLYPYGQLLAIRNMRHITNDRFLLLCADKAYSHEDDSKMFQGVPHVAVHGCFSMMVNFHALRIYALLNQGYSVHTPYYNGLKVAGYVFGSKKEENNEFRLAFNDTVYSYDPDNFSVLQRCIKDETPTPSLKYILSLIRLSKYESEVFYKFKQALIDRVSYASSKLFEDFKTDIHNLAKYYYPIQTNKDIYFDLGRLCLGLRDYDYGIELFNMSSKIAGEHHITWYNLGICYFYLNNISESLRCFLRCLNLSPSNSDALAWKARLETQLTPAQVLDIMNSIKPKNTVVPKIIIEEAIPFEEETKPKMADITTLPPPINMAPSTVNTTMARTMNSDSISENKQSSEGVVLDIDVGSVGDDGEITRDPFKEEEEETKPVEDPFKEEEETKPTEDPFKEEENKPTEDPFKEEDTKPTEDPFKEEETKPTEDPFKEEDTKPTEDPFKEEEDIKPTEDPFKEDETKPTEDPFKEEENKPTEDPFKEEEENKPTEDPFKEEDTKVVEDPFKEEDTKVVEDPFKE